MIQLIKKLKAYRQIRKLYHSSNFGRNQGWIVELNGKVVAKFFYVHVDYPSYFTYKLKVIDKSLEEKMMTTEFWDNYDLKYLSKALNVYATTDPIVNPSNSHGEKYVNGRYLYCSLPKFSSFQNVENALNLMRQCENSNYKKS